MLIKSIQFSKMLFLTPFLLTMYTKFWEELNAWTVPKFKMHNVGIAPIYFYSGNPSSTFDFVCVVCGVCVCNV